jgi:hypothetical protein
MRVRGSLDPGCCRGAPRGAIAGSTGAAVEDEGAGSGDAGGWVQDERVVQPHLGRMGWVRDGWACQAAGSGAPRCVSR